MARTTQHHVSRRMIRDSLVLYESANDPRTAIDSQTGPEMIPILDRKSSRSKNKEWHGWWNGVDRELAYVNTDIYIK